MGKPRIWRVVVALWLTLVSGMAFGLLAAEPAFASIPCTDPGLHGGYNPHVMWDTLDYTGGAQPLTWEGVSAVITDNSNSYHLCSGDTTETNFTSSYTNGL